MGQVRVNLSGTCLDKILKKVKGVYPLPIEALTTHRRTLCCSENDSHIIEYRVIILDYSSKCEAGRW
jgi:hypothetical protein